MPARTAGPGVEEDDVDRIKREMEALRAQLADARTDAERAIDTAAERLLQVIAKDGTSNQTQHAERVTDNPGRDQTPAVVIRHDRHVAK